MEQIRTDLKTVTKIAANPALSKRNDPNRVLRVAAYCRVSTDAEDQLNSYHTQKVYYLEHIQRNPKWRFAGIYADEGITGTMVRKRDDFLRMIADCEKGKIDLILTKSVSRYARNIVDCISYLRKLKALGIGIYFEEQNINSLTEDSELYIGIYGVLAQAESENISESVKWGVNKRMQKGIYTFSVHILGYRRDKTTKEIYIVPEEAETVRKIYRLYLQGNSLDQIKHYLESSNIRTVTGKAVWQKNAIKSILTNEKYVGDALHQKTFRTDPLTKKTVINHGERDRYLVTDNHPAIIDRETFRLVKLEMMRRTTLRRASSNAITELGKYSGKYALSELLSCDICGSPYRRKVQNRGEIKKVYWRCLNHLENGAKACPQAKGVEERLLHAAICRGMSKAICNAGDVKGLVRMMLAYGISNDENLIQYQSLETEVRELKQKAEDAETMCLQTEGDTQRYMEQIQKYYASIAKLRNRMAEIKKQLESSESFQTEMAQIDHWLEGEDVSFAEYDDKLVRYLAESIRVTEDKKLIICIKGGLTITEPLKPETE